MTSAGALVETLREALRTFGYTDGRNIEIEPRYASGEYRRMPTLARELVESHVNLFVVGNERALIAVKAATTRDTPIVVVACDPLQKLLGNLARPGGNATGVTCVSSDLVGKRLNYLKLIIPELQRIALLYQVEDVDASELEAADLVARGSGMEVTRVPVMDPNDFQSAFETIARQRCQALYISVSAFTNFHRARLAELALRQSLPSINGFPEFAEVGGLMSYGATLTDGFKRAAYFVDRLKGASPSDLPAEEPTKFYLVINQKTAAALNITIPDLLLGQADTVIE